MRKTALFVIFFIFLLQVNYVSAYFSTGSEGEGTHAYVQKGYVGGGNKVTVIVVSELANNSEARNWQVSVIVLPDSDDFSWLLEIRDSHMAIDHNYPSDQVLQNGAGEGIGTHVYGPFLVWASADSDTWGDLIWSITLMSRDGRDIYVRFVMRWGWGFDAAPGIHPIKTTDNANGLGHNLADIHPRVAFFVAIVIILSAWRAYSKAVNDRITPEGSPS